MRLLEYTVLTVLTAFIIQFWVLSAITCDQPQNTMGKFYLAMVSASIMGILEVLIYDSYKSVVSLYYYIGLGLSLYMFIYFFRNRVGIDDADYLKQILELNSREMRLSQIKTDNIQVQTIATNTIHKNKKNIDMFQKLLKDKENKMPITKTNVLNYMNVGRRDPPKTVKVQRSL